MRAKSGARCGALSLVAPIIPPVSVQGSARHLNRAYLCPGNSPTRECQAL